MLDHRQRADELLSIALLYRRFDVFFFSHTVSELPQVYTVCLVYE